MTIRPEISDPRLLEFADIVKLEISHPPADELATAGGGAQAARLKLIAENVETPEQFEHCVALGFDGFQGYFLQHPQTFRAKRVPSSRLGTLRLVASLQNEEYSIDEVEMLLSQNVVDVLSRPALHQFQLLQPAAQDRLHPPGDRDTGRRTSAAAVLAAVPAGIRRPAAEPVLNAMTRARMCEQLGRLGGAKDSGPFFITGLFSLLNAMVGMPTQKIVEELPLSPAVCPGTRSPARAISARLCNARAPTSARHGTMSSIAISPPALIRAAYVDALFWAEQARALIAK